LALDVRRHAGRFGCGQFAATYRWMFSGPSRIKTVFRCGVSGGVSKNETSFAELRDEACFATVCAFHLPPASRGDAAFVQGGGDFPERFGAGGLDLVNGRRDGISERVGAALWWALAMARLRAKRGLPRTARQPWRRQGRPSCAEKSSRVAFRPKSRTEGSMSGSASRQSSTTKKGALAPQGGK